MNDLGQLHRLDPAVVDGDPFWSVVRRRHPAATVVLVPPPPPLPRRQAGRADQAGGAARALREAWRVVAPTMAAAGDERVPRVSWRARPGGHALVAQQALRGLGAARGAALLRAVATALGRAGWLLRPSTRGDVAVLDARGSGVELRGEAGPGAVVLTLATGVLVVSAAQRAEVASWR